MKKAHLSMMLAAGSPAVTADGDGLFLCGRGPLQSLENMLAALERQRRRVLLHFVKPIPRRIIQNLPFLRYSHGEHP